jgi:hypothetical protein
MMMRKTSIAALIYCVLIGSFSEITPFIISTTSPEAMSLGSLPKYAQSKLRKGDRIRLAEAVVGGKTDVTLLIASNIGLNESVVRKINRLGGMVHYREDNVDYLRIKAPIEQVEKIAGLPEIQAINLDGNSNYYADYIDEIQDKTVTKEEYLAARVRHDSIAAPGRNTPPENPYLPIRDMGGSTVYCQPPGL